MNFDLVTVGGVTVDLFLLVSPNNPHFKFDAKANELSMHLGDKIVLDSAKFTVGGNAANVAVGVKRLGLKTSIFAEIGDDEFAHRVLKTLKSEGVDTKRLKKGKEQTSFSIILNYGKDRTIFTEKPQREHNFSFTTLKTEWVYLTSLGKKWEETYRKVGDFVEKKEIKLALNPGPTQLDAGLASFSYLLPHTEVLIVNKDEAEKIVDVKDKVKDLLYELKKLGPRIVIITDGERGSHAINEIGEVLYQEALRVRTVSPTGAGDAYSSGVLAAFMLGKSLKESMLWGTKNAASVIRLIGAQTGLMNLEQIN